MFISVDLPAPFSPRSAWTSPSRRSKSMWSLARMPGNRFVIPRSSRTGPSSMGGDSMPETTRGGPRAARLSVLRQLSRRLDARRRLDLSGDDLLPQDCDLRQHLLLQLAGEARTELAQGDPVV